MKKNGMYWPTKPKNVAMLMSVKGSSFSRLRSMIFFFVVGFGTRGWMTAQGIARVSIARKPMMRTVQPKPILGCSSWKTIG